MKFKAKILTACLLLGSCIFLSCEDENATQESDLFGRWNITEALRDNKPTTTMDDMFFVFAAEGQMQTNMTGEVESCQYEVEDEQILQRGGTIETDYKIESLLDDQLILTTTMGGRPFQITLAREDSQ